MFLKFTVPSMRTHTVYLPPPINFTLPASPHTVVLRHINRPSGFNSESAVQTRHESLLGSLLPVIEHTLDGKRDNGTGKGKGTGKRKADVLDLVEEVELGAPPVLDVPLLGGDGATAAIDVTNTWSGDIQSDSPHVSVSQRRSRRLHPRETTHPAFGLSALPGLLQADDSILSLNTTLSNPSQLNPAPTAQDGIITNLPRWTIPLSKLISLDVLLSHGRRRDPDGGAGGKVSLIVCVTGVAGPQQRRTKEERARGDLGTLWISKWEVVSFSGVGGREVGIEVRLWNECALEFGEVVRRGDVVLIEHAEFRPGSLKDKPQLVMSPSTPHPRPTVLYRTLPRYIGKNDYARASPSRGQDAQMLPEDKALRPDLRMSRSDPGVRRVADIARWFADWVGGSCTV